MFSEAAQLYLERVCNKKAGHNRLRHLSGVRLQASLFLAPFKPTLYASTDERKMH